MEICEWRGSLCYEYNCEVLLYSVSARDRRYETKLLCDYNSTQVYMGKDEICGYQYLIYNDGLD